MSAFELWLARGFSRIVIALRDLATAASVDKDVEDELDAYVAFLADEMEEAGADAEEARQRALATLGDRDGIKSMMVHERPWQLLRELNRDAHTAVSDAIRLLGPSRVATAFVGALALAVVLNMGMFRVEDHLAANAVRHTQMARAAAVARDLLGQDTRPSTGPDR